MTVFEDTFIYTVLDESLRTATFGTGNRNVDGNGFVKGTLISGIVRIPDTMNNYKIISLSTCSLRACHLITEITLPNSLVSLDSVSLII